MSCRTGPLRVERPLRGVCIFSCKGDLLWSSRWSEKIVPTNGRAYVAYPAQTGYTRHEVAAPRAVGPSGRTCGQCWQVGQKWVLRPPMMMRLMGVLQTRQGWPVRE